MRTELSQEKQLTYLLNHVILYLIKKKEVISMDSNKDIAIQKIMELSQEQVSKVLIFMAGMEAESTMHRETQEIEKTRDFKAKHPFDTSI